MSCVQETGAAGSVQIGADYGEASERVKRWLQRMRAGLGVQSLSPEEKMT
jgi:hypothetical protein